MFTEYLLIRCFVEEGFWRFGAKLH